MSRPQTFMVSLLVIAVLLPGAFNAYAQDDVINKGPEIKAGIVAILGRFVTWPAGVAPSGGAPIRIGVLGSDPFQQDTVNHLDRKLAGQNVVIERFADIDEYRRCHILVVSKAADFQPVLEKTQGQNVLVIAEAPGLAKEGAVINLVVQPQLNRIQMEINPAAAKVAGLTIDPRVYRLSMVKIIR